MTTEDAKERIDRELSELLEEVRVALPGAEVLFAFLLGVAFTERVTELSPTLRAVYFATLLLTAAATALLIAPTAYHRLRFREGDKERLLVSATRMAIASLVLLLLAVAGAVWVVGDLLYAPTFAWMTAGVMAVWFVWFWFGLPLSRRASDDAHRPDTDPANQAAAIGPPQKDE
jgi:hypothetical protein